MSGIGQPLFHLALFLSRIAIGLYFTWAGVAKLYHQGLDTFYNEAFLPMQPEWVPTWLSQGYGYSLPFLEVFLGGLLVLGLLGRTVSSLLLLMLISITYAIAINDGLLSGPGPFHYNLVYLPLLFLLAVVGSGHISVDGLLARRRASEQAESDESEASRETPTIGAGT